MRVFETLLARISKALERENIPYMVIGGQAVLIHGEPRFTRDIDITLGLDTDQAPRVFDLAQGLALQPREGMTEDFVHRNALFSVEDRESKIVVDFVFSFLPYERQAIQRAKIIQIDTVPVRFASAEDTIIHKLFAGRPRDIEDAKGIVNANRNLDSPYLKKWLRGFSDVAGRDLVNEFEAIEAEMRE